MPTFKRPKHRRAGMRGLTQYGRPSFRQLIAAKGHWRCYYCAAAVPDTRGTLDHLVPIVAGGETKESNVVWACQACNSAKAGHSVSWFRHLCAVEAFPGEEQR